MRSILTGMLSSGEYRLLIDKADERASCSVSIGTGENGFPQTDQSDFDTLFPRKLQNWVDAILKGTPLRAPGEAGLAVQKILNGVYTSAAKGKEVAL